MYEIINNKNEWHKYKDEELWNYKFICDSTIHPDTKEFIPRTFRTNHFVLVNLPIIMGLSSLPPIGLIPYVAQTINQTYNAGMNYFNRNATSDTSIDDIKKGYAAAISSALFVMYSSRLVMSKFKINMNAGAGK